MLAFVADSATLKKSSAPGLFPGVRNSSKTTFPDFSSSLIQFCRAERKEPPMAVRPSPDRSDLESKTREDLQTIAKVKGVDVSARASKASLIEAILGDVTPQPLPP